MNISEQRDILLSGATTGKSLLIKEDAEKLVLLDI